MRVCIVGGGSSAHVLAVLLAGRGHAVTMLTRRPREWAETLELEAEGVVLTGRIRGATDVPVEALRDAEVAILCMPVHQYPVALRWMAGGLRANPGCIVGTVYGQAGFDWMVHGLCRAEGLPPLACFAIGLLPWIARTRRYGRRAISYGPKARNGIACSDDATFARLQAGLLDDFSQSYWGCGAFERVPNFLTLTLTVDNQIIHPSRCYALAHEGATWARAEDIPYFYRDFDAFSAEVLRGVDADYAAVREALCGLCPAFRNPYCLDYLALEHWSYGSHNPDIRASFVNSKTLRDIKPPVHQGPDGTWGLDVTHRFFKDDIAYGLDIVQWFARHLGLALPHVARIVAWYERDIVPLAGERLAAATPETYGLSFDDVMNNVRGGGELIVVAILWRGASRHGNVLSLPSHTSPVGGRVRFHFADAA